MKLKIKDLSGKIVKEIELSNHFDEEYRPDLIMRAFLAIRSHKRVPYGANPMSGKWHVSKLSRRRHDYKGAYGKGISRVPRKTLWRRGMQFYWVAATAPGTVGGRRAHPPKAEKVWAEKINIKERRKAIRSAIAATLKKELIALRNHIIPDDFPFGVVSDIEKIEKTKELVNTLNSLGFEKELERVNEKKVRAGKGKSRNRKYKLKKSLLLIVDNDSKIRNAVKNIPGVEVLSVKNLNVEALSPGSHGIRLTLWSESALNKLKEEKLFM
ncbi:MAG: 50S ribosomal protein L4 [Candidatus Woesearchaeota archaeon]